MIEVVHFQRKAGRGAFSVERLFSDVRSAMPNDIGIKIRFNRFLSHGVFRRAFDAIGAWQHRGSVNHVVGDVHYLGWLLPRRRTVITVLDCVSLGRMTGIRQWLFWLFWYWLPLKGAARVTVISEFSRTELLRWVRYPEAKIHVIPPTLSSKFRSQDAVHAGGHMRLLQVGTAINKNLARLIKALQGLPVTLVIVGELSDAEREDLASMKIDYENHVGLSEEGLLEQYRRAHCVVFASTYEGFGLPIIEAQAVGRPVLTSNVSAMPEAAGGAACLVDPFDIEDIRRGVRRLLEDPVYVSDLVNRGFVNAARYSPACIAEQYAVVYRSVQAAQVGK
jgi:glycosyltransferase involved in cell wall biosynthesis